MQKQIVHIFGNPDISTDSLPLRISADLEVRFPCIHFVTLDPNEEWSIPDPFIIIDTVVGLSDIHVFHALSEFYTSPTVSVHDFDALFNLRYLEKLGKIKRICIIGVPPEFPEKDALTKISATLEEMLPLASKEASANRIP